MSQVKATMEPLEVLIRQLRDAAVSVGFDKAKLDKWLRTEMSAEADGALRLVKRNGLTVALRLARSKGPSLPNTLVGFALIRKHDDKPVVIVHLHGKNVSFKMANSTLIAKVVHSSHHLTTKRIVGSINGTDLLPASLDGTPNTEENLVQLFKEHEAADKDAALDRIVRATRALNTWSAKWKVDWALVEQMLDLANMNAMNAATHPELAEMLNRVRNRENDIMKKIPAGVSKLKGKDIESVLTGDMVRHAFGDFSTSDGRFEVDIKAHRVSAPSNPKAFNIDKLLRLLHERPVMPLYLFLAIADGKITPRYVSMLDETILNNTVRQPIWSGRNAYGGTQLTSHWADSAKGEHAYTINVMNAMAKLQEWVAQANKDPNAQAS